MRIAQAWGPGFEPCVKQWSIVAQSRVVRRQRWLDPWDALNSWCAPCLVRGAVSNNGVRSKTGLWLPHGHTHMHTYEYMTHTHTPTRIWIHANTHAHAPTRVWIHANIHLQQQKYNHMLYSFTRFLRKRGKISDEILDPSFKKLSSLSMVLVGAQVMDLTFKFMQMCWVSVTSRAPSHCTGVTGAFDSLGRAA